MIGENEGTNTLRRENNALLGDPGDFTIRFNP